MTQPARTEATYEDLVNLPENITGEIIDGELIAAPRPARRHLHAASILGGEIMPPYQFGRGGGPGGWIIYDEPEIHLGANVLVPDLAGWRIGKLTVSPEEHRFTDPPDWVCEILSPASARTDRIKKMPIYAHHQVPYAWLIDPIQRMLEVFMLESGRWLVLGAHAENDKVRADPFQEIEIDLSNLWIE
jgi:Uma2 family endonuclease